jgi:uncharacterized protein (DUF305 family)
MRTTDLRRVLVVLVTLAALGSPAAVGQTDPARPDTTAATASLSDLEALFWARQDSARSDFTEADVRFMDGMIGHHAQALIMAALAPANGASPPVQRLAARITNAQRDEIAAMQRWLRDRGQPAPEVHIDGLRLMIHGGQTDHSGHGGHGHVSMPGMLTDAQLHELAAAQGPDFDRLFLAYMIQHHRGAVTMVDELFATDGAAQDEAAFKLASDIHVDQLTEIARMERMLAAISEPGR